jgi:hypothetical protein
MPIELFIFAFGLLFGTMIGMYLPSVGLFSMLIGAAGMYAVQKKVDVDALVKQSSGAMDVIRSNVSRQYEQFKSSYAKQIPAELSRDVKSHSSNG